MAENNNKNISSSKKNAKTDNKTVKKQEKEANITENQAQMVVVIYNAGYSDKLFEVVKKLNINGGTFLKAHGMSKFEAEKFFNVVIEPEKEIALLVVNKSVTNSLLENVYENIGPNTEVQGIAFAINVDQMTDNLNKQIFPESNEEND